MKQTRHYHREDGTPPRNIPDAARLSDERTADAASEDVLEALASTLADLDERMSGFNKRVKQRFEETVHLFDEPC